MLEWCCIGNAVEALCPCYYALHFLVVGHCSCCGNGVTLRCSVYVTVLYSAVVDVNSLLCCCTESEYNGNMLVQYCYTAAEVEV